jgi:hypothetical protein
MSLPVNIENDALRIEVYPQIGAKVASIIDKADKFELLFDYAAELPTTSVYDRPFSEAWHAGWDECFPAVGAGPYPKHPYTGVSVPDHGELWGLPTTAVPAKDGITTTWHGLRFGYRLTRKLFLEGPSIVAHYTLVNLAPFEFRFVWAQHALLSMATPVEIDLGEAACRLSHDAGGNVIDADFQWPRVGQEIDFSRPGDLPAKQGWKIFTKDPISRPAVIRYPSRGRELRIEYGGGEEPGAYWGVWLNTGGWMGHRHLAIEATTGRHDRVDRSIQDRSAGRVNASGKCEWSVRWTVA